MLLKVAAGAKRSPCASMVRLRRHGERGSDELVVPLPAHLELRYKMGRAEHHAGEVKAAALALLGGII